LRHGVDFQQAIPRTLWEQTAGPLADFIKGEWGAWADEVSRKLDEEREIEQWVRELRSRAPQNPAA
jgi:hypothetical protein